MLDPIVGSPDSILSYEQIQDGQAGVHKRSQPRDSVTEGHKVLFRRPFSQDSSQVSILRTSVSRAQPYFPMREMF